MSPTVFERGVRTSFTTTNPIIGTTSLATENGDLQEAFGIDAFLDLEVTVPESVPLGRHPSTISTPKSSAGVDLFVLDSSRPSMLHLYGNEISLGASRSALAVTVRPPGPTTIEFELPTGVVPRFSGNTWRSTTTPFDVGSNRSSIIEYILDGELPAGDYPFKMLWKRGSETLAEAAGTIKVEEVVNRIRLYNPRFNAPAATNWDFPDLRIARTILPASTSISVAQGSRTLTMLANKPLPPGTYFVPTDLRLEYRQGANVYEGSYGYVVVEENSDGRLSLRIREMSMMAAEGTAQGYFSLEGILRRNY